MLVGLFCDDATGVGATPPADGNDITVPSPESVKYRVDPLRTRPQGFDRPEASTAGWQRPPEHVWPWQSWPHVPQLCGSTCVLMHVPLQTVSRHVQVPIWQSGAGCAHGGWLCQLPVESHVWGVDIEHCVAFGVQEPEQVPEPLHTYWQVDVFCHVPVLSQVWMSRPEHRVTPGTQVPVQAPCEQANEHACMFCHAPVLSQFWTLPPAHWFDPGTQTPAQTPLPVQTNGHVVIVVHCAFGPHAWALRPLQRITSDAQGSVSPEASSSPASGTVSTPVVPPSV
jgi:hypothetical protein